MSNPIINFYKSTITQDWSIGTGNFYVSVKPTTSVGRLVVSPNSDTLREIIEYTNTGTDANGDYIVISVRGVGGTTEQSHTTGEKVRMNITAEDWEDMRDDIDSIVAGGVSNASTVQMGGVQEATEIQFQNGTDVGSTGARLFTVPSVIRANTAKKVDVQKFLTSGTWTKPAEAKSVFVQIWSGGGSGAAILNTSTSSVQGGGGGAYWEGFFEESKLAATETITVGLGGDAVQRVSAAGGTDGINGGDSSFGSHITIKGGQGGASGSSGVLGGYILNYQNISPLYGIQGSVSLRSGLYSGASSSSLTSDALSKAGDSVYGGGGGGGAGTGSGMYMGAAGTSIFGGNGGAGAMGLSSNITATAGSFPSGGGGASLCRTTGFTSTSGKGGDGQIIITTFF